MTSKHPTPNVVHLQAFNIEGQCVFDEKLPLRTFYDESHPVLDQADYRMSLKIVRLSGVMYDATGSISDEFEVSFDRAGLCVCEKALVTRTARLSVPGGK